MTGAALIAAARLSARLREQIAEGAPAEVDATVAGADDVLDSVSTWDETLTATLARAELGDTPPATFAEHLERSLNRPRRPTLRLQAR